MTSSHLHSQGAPECLRDDRFLQNSVLKINPCTDIWSFGCVLSEAIVWSVLGQGGLDEYSKLRCEETRKSKELVDHGYTGCFHDGNTVLGAVHKMHMQARRGCRRDDHIISEMIGLAELSLDEVSARPKAHTIYKRARNAIQVARELYYQTEYPPSPDLAPPINAVPEPFQTNNTRMYPADSHPEPVGSPEPMSIHASPSSNGRIHVEDHTSLGCSSKPPVFSGQNVGRHRESVSFKDEHSQPASPNSSGDSNIQVSKKPIISSRDDISSAVAAQYGECQGIIATNKGSSVPNAPTSRSNGASDDPPPHVKVSQVLEWIRAKKGAKRSRQRISVTKCPSLPGYAYIRRLQDRDQVSTVPPYCF